MSRALAVRRGPRIVRCRLPPVRVYAGRGTCSTMTYRLPMPTVASSPCTRWPVAPTRMRRAIASDAAASCPTTSTRAEPSSRPRWNSGPHATRRSSGRLTSGPGASRQRSANGGEANRDRRASAWERLALELPKAEDIFTSSNGPGAVDQVTRTSRGRGAPTGPASRRAALLRVRGSHAGAGSADASAERANPRWRAVEP